MRRAGSILFIHDHFPAQFGALGRWLAGRGWEVAFATAARDARPAAFRVIRYAAHRAPSGATHPYAQPMERAAIQAQAFVRAAFAARRDGYRPDVVVAHSGWGAGMLAKDVFPGAAFVAYCEWWYRHPGADVAYLAALEGREVAAGPEAPMHERVRNAPIAMDLSSAEAAICPTGFQAAQFPAVYQPLLDILHDGIDIDCFRPDHAVRRSTLGGLVAEDARVVTYATRGMEPHRGFPQFMAVLPAIFAADRRAVAVVAGENRVAYGGDALRGIDWQAKAMAENDIDPARIRFVGRLGPRDYLRLLQRSDAHVYLTVPFVLSWSMLEAMSCGCAVVLSDTDPVREFADASAASLVDLARPATIACAVLSTLSHSAGSAPQRTRARAIIQERLAQPLLFSRKERLFQDLLA